MTPKAHLIVAPSYEVHKGLTVTNRPKGKSHDPEKKSSQPKRQKRKQPNSFPKEETWQLNYDIC